MINTELYPLDYPSTAVDGQDDSSELDTFTQLAIQARDTARRQQYMRRVLAAQTIKNQNRLVDAQILPLPFVEIAGFKPGSQPIQGTVAHLAGGRTYNSLLQDANVFYYGNESIAPIGFRLSVPRSYVGTVSEGSYGLYVGGASLTDWTLFCSELVEKLSFDKPSLSTLGVTLTDGGRFGLSGIGNKALGVLIGGSRTMTGASLMTADHVNYATEAIASQGNKLNQGRMSPHNGNSNPVEGVLLGGCTTAWTLSGLIGTSEAYNFTTFSAAVWGTDALAHLSHAAFGIPTKGYWAGGIYNPTNPTAFTDVITGLIYSTQSSASIGAKLSEVKVCADGAGSSAAGYAIGGENTNYDGRTTIDKLNYLTESAVRLGTGLANPTSDRGCVSDYGAGLY
jgi:hypothetical protein